MSDTRPKALNVPRNLKPYYLCLLKKGPRWNKTQGHEGLTVKYLAFLRRETEARRYIFAGPVTDGGEIIATAVLEAADVEEANALANANPGVESGHFLVELHPCFLPSLDGVRVEY